MIGGLLEAYYDELEIEKERKRRRRVRVIILITAALAIIAGVVVCIVLL